MEITHTTAQDHRRQRFNVINVTMPTTGNELADLKTAHAAAVAEDATASWVGNDYAATGKSATFSFEVR